MASYWRSSDSIFRVEICPRCHGRGEADGGRCTCANGYVGVDVTCSRCRTDMMFSSTAPKPNCSICHGSGVVGEYTSWRNLNWVGGRPLWFDRS